MDGIKCGATELSRYLPERVRALIEGGLYCEPDEIDEIRLRRGRPVSFTVRDKNIVTDLRCTASELADTAARLCGGTLHAHIDTIAEGYISFGGGGRAGICGHAHAGSGSIMSVTDTDAISLRVPRSIWGISARLCEYIAARGYTASVLVYSPPGMGKTTLLRDAAAALSRPPHSRRVAVIDTRGELWREDMFADSIADIYTGYSKADGIAFAVRTMSPQLIVCDELGGSAEADAVIEASHTGVPLLASAHASTYDELTSREPVKRMLDAGIFERCFSIKELTA